MQQRIVTTRVDLAKNVIQVQGIDVDSAESIRRQLRRSAVLRFFAAVRPRLAGMEARSSAINGARTISRLAATFSASSKLEAVRKELQGRPASPKACAQCALWPPSVSLRGRKIGTLEERGE